MPQPPDRGRRLLRAAPAAALALVVLANLPAAAGPTERLREFFAAVNTVLADPEIEDKLLERIARIRRLVADLSDVQEAAAVALEHEWEERSPAEQAEFAGLFAELLERAYIGRLAGRGRVSHGVGIAYLGESVAGDEATVQTSLGAKDGGDALVEYRMVNREGRWRVRDLVLDGVSTVENYRAQFRRILSQVSYQDLLGRVRAKLDEATIIFARAGGRGAPAGEPAPTELVLIARPEDGAAGRDHESAVARAVAALRSRDVGWVVSVATALRSRDVGWVVSAVRSRDIGWIVGTATAGEKSPALALVKPPPSLAGTTPARSAAPAAAYWVQVAAFKTAAEAGRLAERLDGSNVFLSAGGRLMLVRVGPFAERARAAAKLRDLEAAGYPRPFIAETRD